MATIRTLYNKSGIELYPRTEVSAIIDFKEGFKNVATELNIIDKTALLNTLSGYVKISNTLYYTKTDIDSLLTEYPKTTNIENNYTKLNTYNNFTASVEETYLRKVDLEGQVNLLEKWDDYYTKKQLSPLIIAAVEQKVADITSGGTITLEGYLKTVDFKTALWDDFKSGQNSTLLRIFNDNDYNSQLNTKIMQLISNNLLEINKESNGGYSTRAETNTLSTNINTQIGTINSSISTLQTDIATAKANITTLQGNIGQINLAIGNIETNYLTAQNAANTYATIDDYVANNDLDTKIAITNTITSLTSRVAALESSIQSINALLTNLENRVTALESGGGE